MTTFKVFWSRLFPPRITYPIIMIDLETTGVGIKNNNIIEIAVIALDKHLALKSTLTIPVRLNGRAKWGKEAEEVHKISEEAARHQGYLLTEAIDQIDEFIAEHYDKPPIPCGFNVHFDMKLIETAYEKKKRKHPFSHMIHELNSIGRTFFDKNSSRHLVPHLGIEVDEKKKHRALYDCTQSLKTLHRLERVK